MDYLGVSRPTFYFDVHGEINTDKTIELARLRAVQPPPLVPVPEAAARLGLSVATVRRRLKDGELRAVRVGRAVRVDLSQVAPPSEEEVETEVLRVRASPLGQ